MLHSNDGKPDVFTDMNGVVAAFLADVANRPVPKDFEPILAEIRRSVAAGTATTAMALTIIRLFPNRGTTESSQRRDN